MKKLLSILTLFLVFATAGFAQRGPMEIFGKWISVDDVSGKEKSIVDIYKKDGKAYGKIIKIFDPNKQDEICNECDEDDPRYKEKILGMEILKGLEPDKGDDEWDDGTILDPNNGKVYDCKMWVEDGKLQVRGYIGFSLIGRTQVWIPVDK